MTCPYRWYSPNLKGWVCTIAYQDCPEGMLEGFEFEHCSTYLEEKGKEKIALHYRKRS